MISKLLSHPLDEARELGEAIKREASILAPALLKYAQRSDYRAELADGFFDAIEPILASPDHNNAKLLDPYLPEEDAIALIGLRGREGDDAAFIDKLLKNRGLHDPAPREFERVSVTFEIVMDYGAYRDIQRHRIATLTTDPLTPSLGWEAPRDLDAFGLRSGYEELMELASKSYAEIAQAGFKQDAAYVLPLAFRVRTLLTANLRELFHLIELRSSRQGHPSYRLIAQQLWGELNRIYPSIAKHIRVNMRDYALTRPA
jgi:thymidylate synthase ThyX